MRAGPPMIMGRAPQSKPLWGSELLRKMLSDDPEMLDLIIGVLFHYDP